tara:strand:- start:119 stop:1567 length:1449 start_codon:yes stop_codon:yes gene_type:complete
MVILKSAFTRWEEVIVGHPTGKMIDVTLDVQTLATGTLGQANITDSELIVPGNGEVYGNRAPTEGFFTLNYTYVVSMGNNVRASGNTELYYVTLHELGHILGIGTFWGMTDAYGYIPPDTTNRFYMAENAVREYRKYFSEYNSLYYIPIEDDGGAGTAYVHTEEGDLGSISVNDRTLSGIFYPGMDIELMTGWANSVDLPLSRVTIGYLDDMNYVVDYSNADDYNGYTHGYLNDHITTSEYWNGYFNLNLTTTSTNSSTIDGSFNTVLGKYEVRYNAYDSTSDSLVDTIYTNIDFNHQNNNNNSPAFITRGEYSVTTQNNSKTFGCIMVSTDSYTSGVNNPNNSYNGGQYTNQFVEDLKLKWYVMFPSQPIFSTSTGLDLTLTVGFGNVNGDGSAETFYIEVYNGTTWVELYTDNTMSARGSAQTVTPSRIIDTINITDATLFNSAVSNSYVVKLRARVVGFQKRDYLILGAYFITETYPVA